MTLVVISVDREHLPSHTEEEFEAWVRYQVGDTGGLKMPNPLADIDMDAEVREIG